MKKLISFMLLFGVWPSGLASDACDDQVLRQVRVDLKPTALVIINNPGNRVLAIDMVNVGTRAFDRNIDRDYGMFVRINGVRYWATSYGPVYPGARSRFSIHQREPWSVDACQSGTVQIDVERNRQFGCMCFHNDVATLKVVQEDGGGRGRLCIDPSVRPRPLPVPLPTFPPF